MFSFSEEVLRMRLAAARPNYLPDMHYFYKMSCADRFVMADDIQFVLKAGINRAPVKLFPGWKWISVPVLTKGRRGQLIKDVKIDPEQNWREKHWKTIYYNYKYAPYFEYYGDFFEALYQKEWVFLIDLSMEIIHFIREALKITCPLSFSSEMELAPGATAKIVALANKLGCNCYLAEPADRKFLEEDLFAEAGIELRYSVFQQLVYRQQFGDFVPGMSIIDLLFNEGPEARRLLIEGATGGT